MTVEHRGFEPVLPHGFNGLLIEPHAEMMNDVNIFRMPVAVNDELKCDDALKPRLTRLTRKIGLHGMNEPRGGDAASDAHDSTAGAAAAPGTDATAKALPDSAAGA